MYQQSIKVMIFSTVNIAKYRSLYSLCKHNCLNKEILSIIFTLSDLHVLFKSKKITHEQVDLIKWDKLSFSSCRSEDKQKGDSRNPNVGKIENEVKAYKASHSQKCNAFHSWNVSFYSQKVLFRSKSIWFVLEVFSFVQTVQHSHGVVVRFRVCIIISKWGLFDNYYVMRQKFTIIQLPRFLFIST